MFTAKQKKGKKRGETPSPKENAALPELSTGQGVTLRRRRKRGEKRRGINQRLGGTIQGHTQSSGLSKYKKKAGGLWAALIAMRKPSEGVQVAGVGVGGGEEKKRRGHP